MCVISSYSGRLEWTIFFFFFLQQMGGFARSVSSRIWEKKNVTKHIYSRKFFLTRCDEAMMERQSPSHPGLRRTAEEPLCNKYLIQRGCRRNVTVLFFRFPPLFILLFFHKFFKRALPADSCWCQRSTCSFSILLCLKMSKFYELYLSLCFDDGVYSKSDQLSRQCVCTVQWFASW